MHNWHIFAAICFGMAITPGPNMMYLVSRSICQGRLAGLVSLGGVAVGLLFYMLAAAFGVTVLLFAAPYAYDALRFCGAAYLAYLAWQTLRPNGRSPFAVRALKPDNRFRLFSIGVMTALCNPKVAILYASLLPQFIDHGASATHQFMLLGIMQIAISMLCNGFFVLTAGAIARFLATRPRWAEVQRYVMGCVLAGFAVKLATEQGR